MPPSPYEDIFTLKSGPAKSSSDVLRQTKAKKREETRRFDDFCARTFKKTWGFGSLEPFRRAEKRAEWAFMNDQDPDNRIKARRDGALAPLRPARGRRRDSRRFSGPAPNRRDRVPPGRGRAPRDLRSPRRPGGRPRVACADAPGDPDVGRLGDRREARDQCAGLRG